MFRKAEKEVAWKAGVYAIVVHGILLGALLVSFNWKSAHPVLNVAEVELWDSLPTSSVEPPPEPEPKIEPKPEPKVEPPPVVKEEPKPEPKVEEPKVDIALEKKKELEQKQAEEKARKLEEEKLKKEKAEKLKQIQASLDEPVKSDKKTNDDALKKLQQDALAEENAEGDKQAKAAKAAANKGVIDKYVGKIKAKIKSNIVNTVCGDGDPVLKVKVNLMPTGELSGKPKVTKSSGIEACDDAVERAIIASQPLPIPEETELKSEFKDLDLTFNPNRE